MDPFTADQYSYHLSNDKIYYQTKSRKDVIVSLGYLSMQISYHLIKSVIHALAPVSRLVMHSSSPHTHAFVLRPYLARAAACDASKSLPDRTLGCIFRKSVLETCVLDLVQQECFWTKRSVCLLLRCLLMFDASPVR